MDIQCKFFVILFHQLNIQIELGLLMAPSIVPPYGAGCRRTENDSACHPNVADQRAFARHRNYVEVSFRL